MRHGKWELNGGSQFFGTMASRAECRRVERNKNDTGGRTMCLVVDSLVLFPVGPEYNLIMDDPLRELRRPTNSHMADHATLRTI